MAAHRLLPPRKPVSPRSLVHGSFWNQMLHIKMSVDITWLGINVVLAWTKESKEYSQHKQKKVNLCTQNDKWTKFTKLQPPNMHKKWIDTWALNQSNTPKDSSELKVHLIEELRKSCYKAWTRNHTTTTTTSSLQPFSSSPAKHRPCISTLYIRFMTSSSNKQIVSYGSTFVFFIGLIFAVCSQWCNPSKPLHFLLL